MYRLNLTFDIVPKSLNRELRTHRFARSRSNQSWDLIIFHMVRNRLPPSPLQKAHLKLVRRYYRTLDFDGLVGSMKPVVDALVTAKVLKDDSWNTLGVWDVSQEFRPKALGPELEIFLAERPT